jgi:hypothetical protein
MMMTTDTPSLTPGTLIDGARMYAAAADAVNDRYPNALHVLSHLLGISIELALMAYLRRTGMSVPDLRRLGHDLAKLLAAAEEHGLVHTGSRHFRMSVLGANYHERLFAYPQEGVLNIIVPARLRVIAHELIEEVFIAVKGQDVYATMHAEPGLCIRSKYPEDLDASAWAVPAVAAASEPEAG